MSIEENTKAAKSFLASLTLSRVGAGLAFASGCVVLYKYFNNGINEALPIAIGVSEIVRRVDQRLESGFGDLAP